jgi:hypothetical protein
MRKEFALAVAAVNALPAVLKYLKGGHHLDLCSRFIRLPDGSIEVYQDTCTCGYEALRAALGGE